MRALTHGVKKDGQSVIFMPSQDYKFTEADMAALIAYIRSVPPVDREVPAPESASWRARWAWPAFPLLSAEFIDHDAVEFVPAADRSEAVEGRRLPDLHCRLPRLPRPELTAAAACPTPPTSRRSASAAGPRPTSRPPSARTAGPTARPSLPAMPRVYRQMPDEDLSKIFAYLKTIPPSGTKAKNQSLNVGLWDQG